MSTSAYELRWSDEIDNVLLCYFRDELTWSLYHPAINELIEEIQMKEARVDVIFVGEAPMPTGNPLPHFKRALTLLTNTDNLGLVVTTGAGINAFTMAIGRVMFKTMGLDSKVFRFETTLEKSYERIKEDRGVASGV